MVERRKVRYEKFVLFPITRIVMNELYISYKKVEIEVEDKLKTLATHRRNILHTKLRSYLAAPVYGETTDLITVKVWINNQEQEIWTIHRDSHYTVCNPIFPLLY
jgi:hypothetical protein